MDTILQKIKENTKLKEEIVVIKNILTDIYLTPGISTSRLAESNQLPVPTTAAIRNELLQVGLLKENKQRVSFKGRVIAEEKFGWKYINTEYYKYVRHSTEERGKIKEDIIHQMNSLLEERPQVKVQLDQAYATIETTVERAFLLLDKQQLVGSRIVFLGDDDLTSVATGLLLNKFKKLKLGKLPTSLFVYEIDEEWLEYLHSISEQLNLGISLEKKDFRAPFEMGAERQADVVFVDPPYTFKGLQLFLSRAVSICSKQQGTIYLSFAAKYPLFKMEMQKLFNQQNLFVDGIYAAFNRYEGASIIGNRSDLYLLKTTETAHPIFHQEGSCREPIYTGDVFSKLRVYQCKECGESIKVGNERAFPSIEELKKSGCPYCSKQQFERLCQRVAKRETAAELGTHFILDLVVSSAEILKGIEDVRARMLEIVDKCRLTKVTEDFHQFEPWGVSGVVVLAESHFTIHTWPEHQFAAVDLFICQKNFNEKEFFQLINQQFAPEALTIRKLVRGRNEEL